MKLQNYDNEHNDNKTVYDIECEYQGNTEIIHNSNYLFYFGKPAKLINTSSFSYLYETDKYLDESGKEKFEFKIYSSIKKIIPNKGYTTGNQELRIIGEGFDTNNTQISIGKSICDIKRITNSEIIKNSNTFRNPSNMCTIIYRVPWAPKRKKRWKYSTIGL